MQHTCKSCGTRVKIPEEWILIGLDQRIKCQVCGNRVNLKIKEFVDKKNASTAKGKTPKGTIIIASKKETNTSYRLSITNGNTNTTLAILDIYTHKTYIVGRSVQKIKLMDQSAEPIIIPTEFDSAVSRVHFELKFSAINGRSKIVIKDLNSLHKTHLLRDGKPQTLGAQEQVFIDISDIVKIGQNTLIGFSKSDF
ncbi:FHA domain-containing protein [Arenibacter sp. F20364]|jgi:DNA-directed RNA polymerase subunit RPC12/RpoP|uniref:FHA domain-containing protein n=1 Tax=Arenibacter sp. F20364 TaxID=2926415 RepID=UPI001FF1B2FD|nr:FHA domain-containing protein [Arenibacter sp. F20364]MCK0189697.1 FHA domain-containing protein [Arenibacter sp. F20364]|tara:strand:- start:29278 stop:29865 length:588 start_codon:yes stop_codon:yes gene_type:complete